MRFRSVAALVVAFVLPMSLLSGCRLFQMDPHEQLDKILAETGDQIVGMDVTEHVESSETIVSVYWVRDGQFWSTYMRDGKLKMEDPSYVFASAGPVSASSFSLDALLDEAREVANRDDCPIASVGSMVEPTGVLGTKVECHGAGDATLHERSRLGDGPGYLPALDFRSAADVETFKKGYTALMGTSDMRGFSYGPDDHILLVNGPEVVTVTGSRCLSFLGANVDTPSTLFPVQCDIGIIHAQDPVFSLDDYDSADIAAVVSGVLSDPELNQSAIISVTFQIRNGALCWDVGTEDIGDAMKYPGKLSGYLQKKSS